MSALIKVLLLAIAFLTARPANGAQVAGLAQGTVLHLASGWNLIAGSASGVNLDAAFYTLNDDGTDYVAVSKDQLEDFKGYWVYVATPTDVTVNYPPAGKDRTEPASCRAESVVRCPAHWDTAKAIPVQQERWVPIANSTAEPLRFTSFFYDEVQPSGATATRGYIINIYDARTAKYDIASPVLVNGARVAFMLRPGEGAWVLSPLTYVFLEHIVAAP